MTEYRTPLDYYKEMTKGMEHCDKPEGFEQLCLEVIDFTLKLHREQLRRDFRHVSLY